MKKGILLTGLLSFGANASLCSNDGYVVGFFNGVWNTKNDAKLATFAFQKKIGNEYNSESVVYETFYNVTGSKVEETDFQDIAEVFIQRAEEIEPDLDNRFDIFWSTVTGDSDGFFDKVGQIVSAPTDLVLGLLEDLYNWATAETVALVSKYWQVDFKTLSKRASLPLASQKV